MLLAYPASVFDCGAIPFSAVSRLHSVERAQRHFTGRVWTLIASAYSNDHCPALVMFARSISGKSAKLLNNHQNRICGFCLFYPGGKSFNGLNSSATIQDRLCLLKLPFKSGILPQPISQVHPFEYLTCRTSGAERMLISHGVLSLRNVSLEGAECDSPGYFL